MPIGLLEGNTNSHAHANEGPCWSHSLYTYFCLPCAWWEILCTCMCLISRCMIFCHQLFSVYQIRRRPRFNSKHRSNTFLVLVRIWCTDLLCQLLTYTSMLPYDVSLYQSILYHKCSQILVPMIREYIGICIFDLPVGSHLDWIICSAKPDKLLHSAI